ncbi:MAG: hypothetical protein GX868_04725 [Actinobacteria bacterium]|nr:hypothetical protein [Actinomycetota bacterium]
MSIILPTTIEPANPVHGDEFDHHVWIDGRGWEHEDFVRYDADGRAFYDYAAAAEMAEFAAMEPYEGAFWDAHVAISEVSGSHELCPSCTPGSRY